MHGSFITFEGGEGAGKSTQIARLQRFLSEDKKISVLATREPGGNPAAEDIRAMLVTGDGGRWDPLSEALLHYTARREHILRTVGPALEKGCWVLCDRFSDSTRAYQGHGLGLGIAKIDQIDALVLGDLSPHHVRPALTLVLDLPVEEGLMRARQRGESENRYEDFDLKFHERVRQGFLQIADAAPERCRIIDATSPPEDVAAVIRQVVLEHFAEALAR